MSDYQAFLGTKRLVVTASGHEHTDECDHTEVSSYALHGLRLWQLRALPHGWHCGCLCCADARAHLGKPMLPALALYREERSA